MEKANVLALVLAQATVAYYASIGSGKDAERAAYNELCRAQCDMAEECKAIVTTAKV